MEKIIGVFYDGIGWDKLNREFMRIYVVEKEDDEIVSRKCVYIKTDQLPFFERNKDMLAREFLECPNDYVVTQFKVAML